MKAHLQPVQAIVSEFIPALLNIQPGELTPTFRRLLSHGVKQGGMNLRNLPSLSQKVWVVFENVGKI